VADFLTYSADYIKSAGIIDGNTDNEIIRPFIISVQDEYMHPMLGTDLFNDIKAEIISGTVSAKYVTLLDEYLVKAIHWYVLAESTPAFTYRYMNKGVMKKNSENSTAVDLGEIEYLIKKWRNKAEMAAERTTKFLKANTDLYPLYVANNDCDDIQPNDTNYDISIYLG
jgi:hypothetical protein